MKTSTRHALHVTLIALSCFTAAAADARAHGPADAVAAVAAEPAVPAAVEVPLSRLGWWRGFGDAEFDQLVAQVLRAARPGDEAAPRAGQLVLVLLGAREYAVHAALASERLAVLQSQRHALAATAPTREAARSLALLDEEVERMRTGLRQHLQLRDAWLAAWSVLSGAPAAAQRVSLHPTLEPAPVPLFEARAPQQPPSWAPQGEAVPLRLAELRQAQDELDGAQAQLQRRERNFHAWRAQATAQGSDPSAEAALLARYGEVLMQLDRVVSARGRLALAWVQFHEALGAE
ncbi:hypothetical protein [Azohydromonas aeria]|uniref:hypothetical protein n=1 Tax=Azohydromonas aeria TaxID=2590212 RepID=UPI0012F8AC08|nr:hypothetical protein [Azohydromonas aeria]